MPSKFNPLHSDVMGVTTLHLVAFKFIGETQTLTYQLNFSSLIVVFSPLTIYDIY